jgi:hypothetical protein
MALTKEAKYVLQKMFRLRPKTAVWFGLFFFNRFGCWFAMRFLDNYFILDAQQKKRIKPELDKMHSALRTELVPQLAAYVRQVGSLFAQPLTYETYEWMYEENTRFREAAFRLLLPYAVEVLVSLRPNQVPSDERFYKQNKRLIAKYQLSEEARFDRRYERIVRMLNDYFGPLSEEQTMRLRELVADIPDLTGHRLYYHRSMQDRFVALMTAPDRDAQLLSTLSGWLFDLESTRSPEFLEAIRLKRIANGEMLMVLSRILTPPQRLCFNREMTCIANQLLAIAPRQT